MEKIKLNFISFLAYPLFNSKINAVFGGAEVDLYTLARMLSEDEKYEITFYVGDYGQQQEEMYGNIRVRKFKYMNLDVYRAKKFKLLRHMHIIKEIAAMDCDVCMVEAYNEMLGWAALLPGRLRNTKLIFRLAHDLDTDLTDAKSKGGLYHWLYWYGIYRADAIVSQTDIQRKMLGENLGLDSRVLKNGFFINEKIDFKDKRYILWVARAQEWKRPELFLELAERLPEEKFVMVMPGDGPFKTRIKEQAARLQNLTFIDYVPFNEIQKVYDGAKLFVNTSRYEGFPNAFVQACLGKTPILSFNVNPDGFIDTHSLGFCSREDKGAAVEFIKGLDHKKLVALGENAGRYVKSEHDIRVIGQAYAEMIEGLAAKRRG